MYTFIDKSSNAEHSVGTTADALASDCTLYHDNNPHMTNFTCLHTSAKDHNDLTLFFYYYGSRHYNPSMGRWVNRDPIGELGGHNLQSFGENAAVCRVDLLGLTIVPIVIGPSPTSDAAYLDLSLALGLADGKITDGIFRDTSKWQLMFNALANEVRALSPSDVVSTTSDPQWVGGTLYWNDSLPEEVRENLAIHELTHRHRNSLGYWALGQVRREEGVGYSSGVFFGGAQGFAQLESQIQMVVQGSVTCARSRRALTRGWQGAWQLMNYTSEIGWASGYFGMYSFSLTDSDWSNFTSTFDVKVSCHELADKYNAQLRATGCCYRFVCTKAAADGDAIPVNIALPPPLL